MKSFSEIVADAIARKYPELREVIQAGRRKAQLEQRRRQEARGDAARIFHSDPNRQFGLALVREVLAAIKEPAKANRKEVTEAWLDETRLFEMNSETAPTHRAALDLMARRRQLGKSVRRRFRELGIR